MRCHRQMPRLTVRLERPVFERHRVAASPGIVQSKKNGAYPLGYAPSSFRVVRSAPLFYCCGTLKSSRIFHMALNTPPRELLPQLIP